MVCYFSFLFSSIWFFDNPFKLLSIDYHGFSWRWASYGWGNVRRYNSPPAFVPFINFGLMNTRGFTLLVITLMSASGLDVCSLLLTKKVSEITCTLWFGCNALTVAVKYIYILSTFKSTKSFEACFSELGLAAIRRPTPAWDRGHRDLFGQVDLIRPSLNCLFGLTAIWTGNCKERLFV